MTRRLCLLLVGAFLGSCGEAPPVPVDHFYRLTLSSPSVAKQRLTEAPIYVENFLAEGLYNERAILFSSDERASELQQHHYYFWFTSPPRLLRDYLLQVLRNADVSPLIMGATGTGTSLRIEGRIMEFERSQSPSGSTVHVALELRLDKAGMDVPLLLRQYRASEAINGKDMAAVVSGFNTAVDRIYGEFLGDMGTALSAP